MKRINLLDKNTKNTIKACKDVLEQCEFAAKYPTNTRIRLIINKETIIKRYLCHTTYDILTLYNIEK